MICSIYKMMAGYSGVTSKMDGSRTIFLLFICLFLSTIPTCRSATAADTCQLHGQLGDCDCDVESIDTLNYREIYPKLHSLLQRAYFRHFSVNFNRKCLFWPNDGRCASEGCAVETCTYEELPIGLQDGNKYSKGAKDGCVEESSVREEILSAVDITISEEQKEEFKQWEKFDNAEDLFCEFEDVDDIDTEYVDLLLNPERYTGYKGFSSQRVWNSIYNENCFKPESTSYMNLLTSTSVQDMCLEKRVFYRLISGLHTSINIHLCALHLMPGHTYGELVWGPNVKEFLRRFDPVLTKGESPARLKNLYFAYLLVFKAITKAVPFLEQQTYYTGDEVEDSQTVAAVMEILNLAKSFKHHFDEHTMFMGDAAVLKEEFRLHFLNISKIMDCVGCDKCRLWGTLQVRGLGTALKILFSSDQLEESKPTEFYLKRTEVVALFNVFGRLSSSINHLNEFNELMR